MKKSIPLKIIFILFLIFFSNSLFADCRPDIFKSEFSAAIRSETYTAENDQNKIDLTTLRKSISNISTLTLPYVTVHSDLEYYWLNNPQDGIGNISLPFVDKNLGTDLAQGYQINALYSAITVSDFTWYHGAVPFKGGRFEEIKNPTVNGGNGLAIINNQVYISDFLKYNIDTSLGELNLIIGKSKFDTKLNYNGLLEKNNGSSGEYLLATFENGNHFFEMDYFTLNGKVKSEFASIEPWHIDILGFGYIYDDSLESGNTFYLNIGQSVTDDNSEQMATSYGISPAYFNYFRAQGASIGDYKNQKGTALLLGYNYEFDIEDNTYDFGFEYFKTNGAWVSTNHGVAFQSDHSWYANRNAQEYVVYTGVNFGKKLRVSTKYVHTDAKSVPNAFSITQNLPKDEAFNNAKFFTHFDKVEFLLNYKF